MRLLKTLLEHVLQAVVVLQTQNGIVKPQPLIIKHLAKLQDHLLQMALTKYFQYVTNAETEKLSQEKNVISEQAIL